MIVRFTLMEKIIELIFRFIFWFLTFPIIYTYRLIKLIGKWIYRFLTREKTLTLKQVIKKMRLQNSDP